MKTTTLLAVVAMLFILSCQKAQTISEREKALNLTAPSGQSIASNIASLRAKTAKAIAAKGWTATDFEVVAVTYLQAKTGVAAVVFYQLDNGQLDSYVVLSGVKYERSASGIKVFLTDSATGNRADDQSFICVKKEDCTDQCKSRPEMIIKENGEFGGFDCGCNNKCETKEVK